ncbi:MAG: ATPase [Firmicutes bacterium]|nr:ATPase [Bacillota bacterium]
MPKSQGKTRDLFLGGNTGNGFFSFYGQLVTEETEHLYILKGGPGTGKSTFIKQAGEEIRRLGLPVEFIHCSSDNDSLDGVVFPTLGIAMIDGTAPHTVDPRYPGAVDEILNLGAFWNKKKLKTMKKTILELTHTGSLCFSKAYAYLKGAAAIYRDWSRANQRLTGDARWRAPAAEIEKEIGRRAGEYRRDRNPIKKGGFRRLFASAITPEGPVHHLESIFQDADLLYLLEGPPGYGQESIINSLLRTAGEKKLTVEVFHCALCPEKIDHLWFPEIKVGVIGSTPPHRYPAAQNTRRLNLEPPAVTGSSSRTRELAGDNGKVRPVLTGLMEKAVAWLRQAKTVHDELEDCYRPYMDFQALDVFKEKILAEILSSVKGR